MVKEYKHFKILIHSIHKTHLISEISDMVTLIKIGSNLGLLKKYILHVEIKPEAVLNGHAA